MAVWLPGAVISPLRIENVPTAWPWDDTVQADDVRGIILFSEPYRTDAQSTLVGLRATCPGMPMVGALAGTSRADRRAWVYLDGDVYSQGAVAVAIEGPYDLLVNVSLGGTPIGSPWTITSVDHNQIITISNRPAIEVMHDTLDEIAARGFGASDLLVGFPMDEYRDVFERDDFVARGILGTENATGSIMVGGIPRQGQSIQFLLRDPVAASNDLCTRLQALGRLQPVIGGILASCKGRGSAMFGRNDHDAGAVARALPDVPVVGLYSLGELGPVRRVPAYNAFAVSLGLIVER
jgi:small ligand-binding sensory domain FIST